MGETLASKLNEIAKHLWWLGKENESMILQDIASKLEFYKVKDLPELGTALIEYREKMDRPPFLRKIMD